MDKHIVKINRHTAQAICSMNKEEFDREPEVAAKRRECFANGRDHVLFADNGLYESKNYIYLWVTGG